MNLKLRELECLLCITCEQRRDPVFGFVTHSYGAGTAELGNHATEGWALLEATDTQTDDLPWPMGLHLTYRQHEYFKPLDTFGTRAASLGRFADVGRLHCTVTPNMLSKFHSDISYI